MSEQYLNDKEVAKLTGLSKCTLRNNRSEKRGIPFIKLPGSRSVRYAIEDVQKYMRAGRVETSNI